MKNLLYGTTYDPEFELAKSPKELQRMKDAGINLLRIMGNAWNVWESQEGVYDFSTLKDTLNACAETEMNVIVAMPDVLPSWLAKKEQAVIDHAFEWICRKILEVTSRYSCVIGYQLSGESEPFRAWQKRIIEHYRKKSEFITCMKVTSAFQEELNGRENAFVTDQIYDMKKPYYIISDTQLHTDCPPYTGQIFQNAMSHLSDGADGVECRRAFLHTDALYAECEKIGEAMQKLAPYLENIKRVHRAAMLVNEASMAEQAETIRSWHGLLYEMNIGCDILREADLAERIADYSLLFVPAFSASSKETVKKLRGFVKRGGVLLAGAHSFTKGERAESLSGLSDVFGTSFQQITRAGTTCFLEEPLEGYAELLIPKRTAKATFYEHKYWSRYAGLVQHDFHEGKGLYLGCEPGREVLKQIFYRAADLAGDVGFAPEIEFPIIIRSVVNGQGQTLHFLFNYSQEERELCCPFDKAKDVLGRHHFRKGERIILKDWDCKILLTQ